ncbi:hypothetical protein CBM2597_P340009 [Cupriavidus taiwanensis]|nr:hypothetical protein CBM2597_P340009 [Cupriavidus taiwanensis]
MRRRLLKRKRLLPPSMRFQKRSTSTTKCRLNDNQEIAEFLNIRRPN